MRSHMLKAALALAAFASGNTLMAKDSLGVFGGWAAFSDPDQRRCYAIAAPLKAGAREGQPYASIGTWPGRGVRNQVYFRLGRQTRKGTRISLRVGSRWYRMAGGGVNAWAADTTTNAAILAAMRSSQSMTIAAFDTRGVRYTDRYPLAGAATAIDAAIVGCAR